MKILSYGHIKPKEKFCGGCGATYEYLPRDIKVIGAGTKNVKNYVICPVCGHSEIVNDMLVKHDKYMTFKDTARKYTADIGVSDTYVHNGYEHSFGATVTIEHDLPRLINAHVDAILAVTRGIIVQILKTSIDENRRVHVEHAQKLTAEAATEAMHAMQLPIDVTRIRFNSFSSHKGEES